MSDSAASIITLREVRATFANSAQMQDAVSRLSMSGFDRADLSLPSPGLVQGMETPEAGTKAASTDTDAQQARTLGASTAAAAASMAAAGIAIASGGAAVPALVAAAVAGGADITEQADRDNRATNGDLVLAVRATTEENRSEAEAILLAAGATDIETI
jgi:hypothetical protein